MKSQSSELLLCDVVTLVQYLKMNPDTDIQNLSERLRLACMESLDTLQDTVLVSEGDHYAISHLMISECRVAVCEANDIEL